VDEGALDEGNFHGRVFHVLLAQLNEVQAVRVLFDEFLGRLCALAEGAFAQKRGVELGGALVEQGFVRDSLKVVVMNFDHDVVLKDR